MAGGFRHHLLFPLYGRAGVSTGAATAGFRTPFPPFLGLGGIGATPVGFRTPFPPFLGLGGVGEAIPGAAPTGGGWLSPEQVRRLKALRRRANRKREKQWQKAIRDEAANIEEIRQLYNKLHGIAEPALAAIVADAVEPARQYSESEAVLPPMAAFDWTSLAADAKAVSAMVATLLALDRENRLRDDEDAVIVILGVL